MTPDPYRVAYETALADVTEITAQFEQLRRRKGQVENLIAALQPVFAAQAGHLESFSAPAPSRAVMAEENSGPHLVNAEETPEAEEQGSYSYLDVPAPLPQGDGDAFERRVKSSFRFKGLTAQRSY